MKVHGTWRLRIWWQIELRDLFAMQRMRYHGTDGVTLWGMNWLIKRLGFFKPILTQTLSCRDFRGPIFFEIIRCCDDSKNVYPGGTYTGTIYAPWHPGNTERAFGPGRDRVVYLRSFEWSFKGSTFMISVSILDIRIMPPAIQLQSRTRN